MTNGSDKKSLPWWPAIITVVVVVALWWVVGWIIPRHASSSADAGTFGDMFGGVNALFSGLAFAGIIYAIFLQRQELKLQRDELELTRAELAGQKEQLQAQNETFKRENFENTFFQLLRLHNDIVNAIDLKGSDVHVGWNNQQIVHRVTEGRDCFQEFHSRLRQAFHEHKGPDKVDNLDTVGLIYERDFYSTNEQNIGHYFRSLYNIVKLIDGSSVENKRLYTNIVRAQLSRYEVSLLFYNCISVKGCEKFKPLVERYALLKMINSLDLFYESHKSMYAPSAYVGPPNA